MLGNCKDNYDTANKLIEFDCSATQSCDYAPHGMIGF